MNMDKYLQFENYFKAFSDANRLRILEMLSRSTLCANELLQELNVTQPTLSHHMKTLTETGVVKAEKRGKSVYYSINNKPGQDLIGYLFVL